MWTDGNQLRIERMFEDVKVHHDLARIREKGVDIWLDRDVLYPDWDKREEPKAVPFVRERGLSMPHKIPATLHAWVRTDVGLWAALVSYRVSTPLGELPMFHVVPKAAVAKRYGKFESEPF